MKKWMSPVEELIIRTEKFHLNFRNDGKGQSLRVKYTCSKFEDKILNHSENMLQTNSYSDEEEEWIIRRIIRSELTKQYVYVHLWGDKISPLDRKLYNVYSNNWISSHLYIMMTLSFYVLRQTNSNKIIFNYILILR